MTHESARSEDTGGRGHIPLRLEHLAIGGTVFGVAATITLVVVLLATEADALASIALVLAIVTFVSQLIVFVAQSAQAASQTNEAHTLHTQTMATVGKIEAHSRETRAAVGENFDKILNHALINAKESVPTEDVEGDDQRALQQHILSEVHKAVSKGRAQMDPTYSPSWGQSDSSKHVSFLKSWPSNEGMERLAADSLGTLSSSAAGELRRYALDLLKSLQSHIPDGLSAHTDDVGIRELMNKDVIVSTGGSPSHGKAQYRLNGFKGRAAARLVLSPGPVPEVAHDLFPWLGVARDEN